MNASRYPLVPPIHYILICKGLSEPIDSMLNYYGPNLLCIENMPTSAGFYIWEGEVWHDDGATSGEFGGRGDPDQGVDGKLRPATPTEIEIYRLGFKGTIDLIDKLRAKQ